MTRPTENHTTVKSCHFPALRYKQFDYLNGWYIKMRMTQPIENHTPVKSCHFEALKYINNLAVLMDGIK